MNLKIKCIETFMYEVWSMSLVVPCKESNLEIHKWEWCQVFKLKSCKHEITLKPLLHNKLDSKIEVCFTLFYIVLELIAIELMLWILIASSQLPK
jgi:hypothetical protein